MTMTMTMNIFLFLFIFQHLCHLLFVIGRAQGQAGWVFCINTLISHCSVLDTCKYKVFCINTSISIQHLLMQANSVALLYRWKYKYKSFLSTAWSQYSIFVCRHIETRPSILCVTHQMNHENRNYSAVPYEVMNYKWYLVVLGQYKLVLLGFMWYWVSIGPFCLYILEKVP